MLSDSQSIDLYYSCLSHPLLHASFALLSCSRLRAAAVITCKHK